MFENEIGYSTDMGTCAVGDTLELLEKMPNNSIDLVMTSPPYALQRKKAYGNEEQSQYVDWLCQFGDVVYRKLASTGSFVIDIGGAYKKDQPAYSLYQFRVLIEMCDRFGFELAQPFYWHNTAALPAPIEWVNKRKLRAKTSIETCWWLVKNPREAKADVTNVLTPYSDRMKKMFKHPEQFVDEGAHRPSGHVMGQASWVHDNGGAIPPNLLQIANSESNSPYLRMCKALGVKRHPARFPAALPEFFIKFLTKPNDIVVDIFSGSNTTGFSAEKLGRRWLSFDLEKEYVASSAFRFCDDKDQAQQVYDDIMDGNHVQITESGSMGLFESIG